MTESYGVNGCDGCAHGTALDVAERLATARHALAAATDFSTKKTSTDFSSTDVVPLWVVLQAFGGEGHWSRPPTGKELRVMAYVAIVHGAKGTSREGCG